MSSKPPSSTERAENESGVKRKWCAYTKEDGRNMDFEAYQYQLPCAEYLDTRKLNTPHRIAPVTYLPNWGIKEAMRELLTNTLDQARAVAELFKLPGEITLAEVDNALMIHINGDLLAEIKWRRGLRKYVESHFDAGVIKSRAEDDQVVKEADTMCMELINYSSYLPWESFYFGVTSKANSKNMIGTHGEGLSAACTVLLRLGCNISVTTSAYKTRIVQLQKYACFQVKRQRELEDHEERDDTVHFTIVFKPPAESINVKAILASIRLATTIPRFSGTRGELLTTEPYCGKQYNRGIFVSECIKGKCLFGYNFYDPDKTLLQSRDRNSHNIDACLRECGSVLSEAILADPEVCEKVLRSLICEGAMGAGGVSKLAVYDDLHDGAYLTAEAKEALRLAQEKSAGDNRKMIFCGNSTTEIKQLADAQDMTVVFSHRMLHNYTPVKENFYTSLVRSTVELPAGCLLAKHQTRVMELLECEQMLQSNLQLPLKLLSFWRWQGIMYVTGLRDFELALMKEGLSEEQEINMHKTLTSCGLELREVIPIVRLFHEAASSRRSAGQDAARSIPEELRRQLRQELRKEVQAELDEKEERQHAARAALEARRQAAQKEREEAQQALEAQQREAERAARAAQEAERAKATRRAQEEARLAQRKELERAVAEAVQAERAEAERRTATAVEEALRHEEAARAVQAVKEADEKQRRDAARALKAEAQQRLAERELQQQAELASALEIQDAQHRAVLAAQEAQHRAALEAVQAEYRALLRAQEEREREAALLAESAAADVVAGHREVYHALLAQERTVGTVVEREDPEVGAPAETATERASRRSAEASWAEDAARRARKAEAARAVIAKAAALLRSRGVQPSATASTAVRSEEAVDSEGVSTYGSSGHLSEVSSVDGDDASEDTWYSLDDDTGEFLDEISSASEGPRDPAEVDTSRENVSSDDILGTASDGDSRGSTPSAVIPARSKDRLQAKGSDSPPSPVKAHKQVPVRQCIQLCPAQGDTPASEVAFYMCCSGVLLYTNSGTTEQLTDRVDEFLSLPGMRAVSYWLAKHFTLIAFQAALPAAGRHRAPVFRGDGWDIMLNFSGACWDAEMMSDSLRLCLSGISVAEIVMNDRF